MKPSTRAITTHLTLGSADPLEIRSGPSIVPVERIKLFSPSEWEGFVDEWASSLTDYALVERASGAGDMGCDVIGTVTAGQPDSDWDNFQCKHYDHPLAPSDIWLELGKLCYFSFRGEYSVPRRYFFVAPRGVGTKLMRLLKKPEALKARLLELWADKCEPHLVTGKTVALDDALRAHIEAIDFSIFRHLPPSTLIEGHKTTPYFAVRFGLGLPPRPASPEPPTDINTVETRYVAQLLEAYGDHLKSPISLEHLPPRLVGHFQRARQSFYCAEALRSFSRDTLPPGAFENLQNQIYDGVVDVCEAHHPCGLTRVDATTRHAGQLAVTSSALLGRMDVIDRRGICHQLANKDRLTWVPGDA